MEIQNNTMEEKNDIVATYKDDCVEIRLLLICPKHEMQFYLILYKDAGRKYFSLDKKEHNLETALIQFGHSIGSKTARKHNQLEVEQQINEMELNIITT